MKKKLVRHGNSFALVIDRAILELLHAKPESTFEIVTDGQSLLLTPIRTAAAERKLEAALARAATPRRGRSKARRAR
jgi:antitoxin component of MazEF toxin-antitoxin module